MDETKQNEAAPAFRVLSWEALAVFVAALAVTVVIQGRSGAYQAEFAWLPDEAAHFVSSTLVYDYLMQGMPESPLPFAERYYAHYPKVGIGHWPPGFHTMLAGWMLVFGVGRVQVILFIGVLMAASALMTYWLSRRVAGPLVSGAAVLLFLLLPLSQAAAIAVMTEAPLAFWCLAALIAYVRYLEKPSWTPAIAFGLLAAAGLLTKGSAVGLAFIPPLAVLALGRFQLLLRPDFWAPAVIVLAVAGPWYYAAGNFVPAAMGGAFNRVFLIYRGDSAWDRMLFWGHLAGLPVAAAALIGWSRLILRPGRGREMVAVVGALVVGTSILNVALPESAEPRHIHHAASIVALFAAVGLAWCASLFSRPVRPVVWGLAALLFYFQGYREFHKESVGLADVAKAVVEDSRLDRKILIISSEGFGEGAFIAEMALLRPHPHHVVLRANQLLARVGWSATEYRAAYREPLDLSALLAALPVSAVVLDRAPPSGAAFTHHGLLEEVVALRQSEWKRDEFDGDEDLSASLYRSVVEGRRPTRPLKIYRGFFSFDAIELPVEEIGWPTRDAR